MAINIGNILLLLQENFKNEKPSGSFTEKEISFADELVVLLTQSAQEPLLPPWVEFDIFLDHEPEAEEIGSEEDDSGSTADKEKITFDYRKRCVEYWRNNGNQAKRSYCSVKSKFKKLKK